MMMIADKSRGAETNVAGDGMKKRYPLDIKEISTKCNVEVMLGHWRGKGHGLIGRDVGRGHGLGGCALDVWHVGAINGKGVGSVGRGNRTVMKEVLS